MVARHRQPPATNRLDRHKDIDLLSASDEYSQLDGNFARLAKWADNLAVHLRPAQPFFGESLRSGFEQGERIDSYDSVFDGLEEDLLPMRIDLSKDSIPA